MVDLLYEIGTEELPAGYLGPALKELAEQLRGRLVENRLQPAEVRTAGTPRRMTVWVGGIPREQPPLRETSTGPPAAVAFDEEGNPTAAAEGFARSRGVAVEELEVEETEKGPYAVAVVERPGRPAAEVLPDLLRQATAAVTFPKSMRWEESGFTFARSIRSLLCLLGEQVLSVKIAGVEADRITYGHPFLSPGGIRLADASWQGYLRALREAFVIADPEERRRTTREGINALLAEHGGALEDEELLAEVTNLVEWPHAVEGRFEEEFLSVPAPVLVAAMKEHQRYFPVYDADRRLAPRFAFVSNRTEQQQDVVRAGNERVLRARLEDAKFFWEEDRRRGLEDLVPELEEVVFLADLGDNLQRTRRLSELATRIAERVPDADTERVRRAALLCKADLLTGLVGEFPGLQGVVGRELAREAGEPEPVARAIAEHYQPSGADDPVPETPEGACLALADKLDVIAGCFALGLLPSGSQDPYALRRNALGILLIIEQKKLDLHLGELLETTAEVAVGHGIDCDEETVSAIREFFRDRLYHAALDRGHPHDFVRAVLAAGCEDVTDFWRRTAALSECAQRPWWPNLVELVDRTYRIQRDLDRVAEVRRDLLEEPLEKDLASVLRERKAEIARRFRAGDYVGAAELYCSQFAELVHDFFEEVFVNVEDEDVRLNRKSLCGHVYRLFAAHFADLYLIETAEGGRAD